MPAKLELDALFKRSDAVAHRRIEDEVLLIPIRTDARQGLAVYSLNLTASLLWDMLDGEHSLGDLVAAVCERFEVAEQTARADVEGFCQELLECRAIEQVEPPPAGMP